MAICRFAFDFIGNIAGSTPPFRTGFDFECDSLIDMEECVEDVDDWWTAASAFRGLLASTMTAPILTAFGDFGGLAQEYSKEATDAPTGSTPDLPGVSLRAVKMGNRPVGGRRGSMFWPGLEGSSTGADGSVDGADAVIAKTALDGLIAAVESTPGRFMVTKHVVGGDTTATAVTEFSIWPKCTFMNRRYRT